MSNGVDLAVTRGLGGERGVREEPQRDTNAFLKLGSTVQAVVLGIMTTNSSAY